MAKNNPDIVHCTCGICSREFCTQKKELTGEAKTIGQSMGGKLRGGESNDITYDFKIHAVGVDICGKCAAAAAEVIAEDWAQVALAWDDSPETVMCFHKRHKSLKEQRSPKKSVRRFSFKEKKIEQAEREGDGNGEG